MTDPTDTTADPTRPSTPDTWLYHQAFIESMTVAELQSALYYLSGYTSKGVDLVIELTIHGREETRRRQASELAAATETPSDGTHPSPLR